MAGITPDRMKKGKNLEDCGFEKPWVRCQHGCTIIKKSGKREVSWIYISRMWAVRKPVLNCTACGADWPQSYVDEYHKLPAWSHATLW